MDNVTTMAMIQPFLRSFILIMPQKIGKDL